MKPLIQFEKIENHRIFLGFTEQELDRLLLALEKHCPQDDMTGRLDTLSFVLRKEENRSSKSRTVN